MNVGIYVRVSTEDQAREGYSIPAQKERLLAFCQAQDWTVAGVYADEGVSGAKLDRPQLAKLREDVAAGRVNMVLVWKTDRLSRRVSHLAQLVEEFDRHGCALRSATEPFDTSHAAGRAFLQMLAVFAELERETIRERSKMGIRQKVQSGLLHGRPRMLGYRSAGNGRWEIEPAEAAVVRWIYQQYLAGVGSMRIAQALLLREPADLASEVLEREFGGMTANSVSDRVRWILHNAVYAGYAPLGEELFPGRHEAIIPPAEWHQAQELFGRRRVMGNRSQTSGRYLLSGIIHCAECGGQMWGYSADSYPRGKRRPANPTKRAPGQNRYEYYVCKNASTLQGRSKTCTNWGVAKHRAETAVLDLLRRVALDPATLADMAPASDDSKVLETERRQVQASLGRIEQRRKRLLEAMEAAPDLEGDLL
ncbi:MAG: recombinase family protein, partial [Chitinophagales bacterium]